MLSLRSQRFKSPLGPSSPKTPLATTTPFSPRWHTDRSVGRRRDPATPPPLPLFGREGGALPRSALGRRREQGGLTPMHGWKESQRGRERGTSILFPSCSQTLLSLSLHPSFSHPWREKREKKGRAFFSTQLPHALRGFPSELFRCLHSATKPDGAPSQTRTYGCERVGKGRGPTLSISHQKEKTPNNFLLNHRCSEEEEAKPREEMIF